MIYQPNAKASIQNEPHPGGFHWAVEHPGIMALGALLVAILMLSKPLKEIVPNTGEEEEVPLFI